MNESLGPLQLGKDIMGFYIRPHNPEITNAKNEGSDGGPGKLARHRTRILSRSWD